MFFMHIKSNFVCLGFMLIVNLWCPFISSLDHLEVKCINILAIDNFGSKEAHKVLYKHEEIK